MTLENWAKFFDTTSYWEHTFRKNYILRNFLQRKTFLLNYTRVASSVEDVKSDLFLIKLQWTSSRWDVTKYICCQFFFTGGQTLKMSKISNFEPPNNIRKSYLQIVMISVLVWIEFWWLLLAGSLLLFLLPFVLLPFYHDWCI